VAITNNVTSCKLLADAGREITVEPPAGDGGVKVQLSGEAPDEICSVVELVIEGAPEVLAGQGPPPTESDRGGL
jgi:hypothetical protein